MMQFLMDNWQAILTGFTGIFTGLAGFFYGKKERAADLAQKQGGAVETAQKIYDTLMEDIKEQYQQLKDKVNVLEERERIGLKERAVMEGQLREMGKQISAYERRVAELKKEISGYEKKVLEYEQQVQALKAELSKYQNKIENEN
jgi:chromosome segregation ATPase